MIAQRTLMLFQKAGNSTGHKDANVISVKLGDTSLKLPKQVILEKCPLISF